MEDWTGILSINLMGCLILLALLFLFVVFIILLVKFFIPIVLLVAMFWLLTSIMDERQRSYNDYQNRRHP